MKKHLSFIVVTYSKNPRWGASNILFLRWLPAEYEDGISSPKGWTRDLRVNNQLIPSMTALVFFVSISPLRYNRWRTFCGLSQPRTQSEFAEVLSNTDLARRLLDLYGPHLLPESSVTTLGSLKFLRNLSGTDLEPLATPSVTPSLHLTSVPGRRVLKVQIVDKEFKVHQVHQDPQGRAVCQNPLYLLDLQAQQSMHHHAFHGQNSYDPKTGFLTCEHPGVYEFDFHCIIYQNETSVDLLHNGDLILHSFTSRQNECKERRKPAAASPHTPLHTHRRARVHAHATPPPDLRGHSAIHTK
ncbi:hypothetical protein CCH79_00009102 [Gambusia affinis]|uniref:C1q domain-containing protein n=1 Tax=Gambusia affinis TaxID=33528 RepID=A0A315VAD6_GAMAF|nr:hypothetical protein CCH79_00009102 [Gambusia affinis]